jgi:hypothetical protein
MNVYIRSVKDTHVTLLSASSTRSDLLRTLIVFLRDILAASRDLRWAQVQMYFYYRQILFIFVIFSIFRSALLR